MTESIFSEMTADNLHFLIYFSKRDIMRHTQQTVFQMITKKSNTLTTFMKTTYAPELIS